MQDVPTPALTNSRIDSLTADLFRNYERLPSISRRRFMGALRGMRRHLLDILAVQTGVVGSAMGAWRLHWIDSDPSMRSIPTPGLTMERIDNLTYDLFLEYGYMPVEYRVTFLRALRGMRRHLLDLLRAQNGGIRPGRAV